jgi:hypothetical protein
VANLEDIFRISGIPRETFVEPQRYNEIMVSVRTPGRCSVIEGPSGIGKTTIITRVLSDLGIAGKASFLSARRSADLEIIEELQDIKDFGIVIVDDFHRLPDSTKAKISNYMKVLADEESETSKIILVGINKAGQQLINFAYDLGLRMDVFRLESNPQELLELVAERGATHLNIEFPQKAELAQRAMGSFHLMQLLCYKCCILDSITETQAVKREVATSANVAVEDALLELSRQFKEPAIAFARGSRLRREGRAPYLHLLKWLSEAEEWSLDIRETVNAHPTLKGSVSQVVEKGWLESLLTETNNGRPLSQHFNYQPASGTLTVEDPKLIFYLRNLIWRVFTHEVGYKSDFFQGKYDFALSFAGADRDLARRLNEILEEREVPCFYDHSEQHRIISQNVEDYLAPIYRSEARYVVAILSPNYPTRIWTKFESDQFRDRFGRNEVIPIRFTNLQPGFFSDDARYGGLSYDPDADLEVQAQEIVDALCKRLIEDKSAHAVIDVEVTD